MTENDFLSEIQELLRTDDELTFDTELDELDTWDSVAMLAIAGFAEDEFGVSLEVTDFKNFRTVGDIYNRLNA